MSVKFLDNTGTQYIVNKIKAIQGEIPSESAINALITAQLNIYKEGIVTIVSTLPASGEEGKLYLVVDDDDTDVYVVYTWENNAFRRMGAKALTLTVDSALSSSSTNPVENRVVTEALNLKADVSDVHDATLTIQTNGTTVQTFSANASSDVTCDITVPTKTSDLTNDSDFVDTSNDAVASGITSTKVTSYDSHIADNDIHVTTADKDYWDSKQDSLSQAQLDAISQVATNTSDIATLQSDKADASHTHSSSDITDIDDYATKQYVTTALDDKLNSSDLVAITTSEIDAMFIDS